MILFIGVSLITKQPELALGIWEDVLRPSEQGR